MNRTAWIFCCIPILTLGCHSAQIKEIATEPNSPQEQACSSIGSGVLGTEPNTSFEPKTFILSGSLGVGHVTLRGLPGDPNSLSNGTYSVIIDAGWSGTVTPEKGGFGFSPASRSYEPFTQDIRHEIYIAKATSPDTGPVEAEVSHSESQSLTGFLRLEGVPIQGITLRTLTTRMATVTDANGFFSLAVPADWTGTLRLQAPAPTKNTVSAETSMLACDLETEMADVTPATEAESATLQMDNMPLLDQPLITLGTPSLSVEATSELAQDLKIMSQLLSETAFGISLVKRDPNSEPRPIYLAGEGALFTLCIDWPLAGSLPEPKVPDLPAEWKTARDYIQGQAVPEGPLEKLHHLKTQAFIQKMTHCLIHAANIRHLGKDDHITLHVWGPPPSENLVIRARLNDINDYAEAVLTGETFEEQVVFKMHKTVLRPGVSQSISYLCR